MNFFEQYADFIGPVVHARDINFAGNTATFYFRELSADDGEAFFRSLKGVEGSDLKIRQKTIACIVCDAEGNAVLDETTAGKLKNGLATLLQEAAFEVNAFTEKAKEEAGNAL